MTQFYITPEKYTQYAELQPLLDVQSKEIEGYFEPFQALIRSRFLNRLVQNALNDLHSSTGPFPSGTSEVDLQLLRTDDFSLGVRITPRQMAETFIGMEVPILHLVALPNDVLMGVVGPGRAEVDLFRSAFKREQSVFRGDHRLEFVERRSVAAGSVIQLRAGEDVARFVSGDDRIAVVELATRNPRQLVWNYDPATLQASYASSASVEATRAEFAIQLFELFGYREAVPNLLELARSRPEHWVRWRAIKAALQLDLEGSLGVLREATEDPHPHVRKAAQATLTNLKNANLSPGE